MVQFLCVFVLFQGVLPRGAVGLTIICVGVKVGIEDSLCPRHLPIIARSTITFPKSCHTISYLLPPSDQITVELTKSGILGRKGEKEGAYFI